MWCRDDMDFSYIGMKGLDEARGGSDAVESLAAYRRDILGIGNDIRPNPCEYDCVEDIYEKVDGIEICEPY